MPINLLGNLTNPFQQTAPRQPTGGMSVYKPPVSQPAGTVGMNTPQGTQYVPLLKTPPPMGVTAKNPASSAPAPVTTLPKTQQNPVVTPTPSVVTPTPASAPSQASTQPTYSGLLGQAVNTATQGAPAAMDFAKQAAQYGAGSIPIAAQAQDIASQFGQKYADIGQEGAKFQAGQLTTGTTPVAEGNAAVTAQTTAAQQQALAQGEQAALQGLGYQLTGQQQAANAAQAASGVPLSIYGTQLGALQNAYGSAKPELGSPYQIPFSPINQEQGAPLGSTTPGGLNALAQNFGTFQGIQSGAQAAAAAPGQGVAGVYQSLPALSSANTAAKGISNTIQTYLQQNPTLNANTATVANLAQQWLQGKQLGNPQYQTFFNYLSEYANTLAPVLGVGGDPTNMKTQIAQAFINAGASGQSISQVLDSMNSLAENKIRDIQSGATGGGTSVPAPSQSQNASLFSW